MTAYILSKSAQRDLQGIVEYSLKNWGKNKAQEYIYALEQGATELAQGAGYYKEWFDVAQNLRIKHVKHHYIFCLAEPNDVPIVIAIFHERMDLLKKLRHRLN